MKFISVYTNLFKIAILLTVLASFPGVNIRAQQQAQTSFRGTSLAIQVLSTDDKPVQDAQITIGEGLDYFKTDKDGKANIVITDEDEIVTIHKYGYGRLEIKVTNLREKGRLVLETLEIFADPDDVKSLPFAVEEKRSSLGSSYLVKGEDLEKLPSTDIRRSLTGLVPGLDVTENHGGPGITSLERINRFGSMSKVDLSMRGKTPIYMLDNMPIDVAETPLDPQQIESITVVKDLVEKALYGPFAANGIIHIKTKRGAAHSRQLNVNYEEGVNVIDRMPEFVGGVEYAKMNNIARNNSGLTMLYAKEDISRYAKEDPYDMLYPNVNFKDMMIKNSASYRRANVSTSGGNESMTYYSYLGYSGEGDIYKIGPASNYNRINFSANLDVRLNSFIKSRFGFFSNLSNRKSPNYGYNSNYSSESETSNWTMDAIEFSRVIGHLTTIPHISFPVYANNEENLTRPYYAVSPAFTQNPIGNIMHNGSYNDRLRKGLISAAVDMDFSFLLKGLTSTTSFTLDANNLVRLGTAEDYSAYLITKGVNINGEEVPVLTRSSSHSLSEMSNKTKLTDYNSQRLFGYQKFDYKGSFGKHDIGVGTNLLITKRILKYISEHRREVTGVLTGNYAYDKKYLFQTAMAYSGTYSLKNNRYSFSPTVAAGWIVSDEDFMKENSFVDYLKLRSQYGVMSYDGSMSAYRDMDSYAWDNTGQAFGPHTANQWFGSTVSSGTMRVQPGLMGNEDLRLERRQEFILGAEALTLGRKLYIELNYYNHLHDGPVTNESNQIPHLSGLTNGRPWINYNKTRYFGFEFAAQYSNRVKGTDFSYALGLNATVQNSRVLRYDELDYEYAYQSRIGYPNGSIFGLVHTGFFATDAEAVQTQQSYDEQLHAGDLRYLDMNGDGIIDDSDRAYIGNAVPKLFLGVNINLQYKAFDLHILGTGRFFYDIPMTNAYFWNGWGDNNYSKFTLENLGREDFPRLTYDKVNNNYKLSNFWLEDGNYFKVKNVESGWNLPVQKWGLKNMRKARIYARAANVLTITKVKDVDPEAIDSGISHYPLFMTFTGGIQLTF